MVSKIIQAEDYVIAKKGTSVHLVQILEDRPVYISKQKLHLRNAIGKPYGSCFEICGHDIQWMQNSSSKTDEPIKPDDAVQKDNRSIFDDGKSQKLTKDDIEDLKAKGISGEEIIENLIENSSTFKEKSTFSQEKYLKKKKEKYVGTLLILMPNTRLLVQMYYSRNPLKICNMRLDSLAQMLAYCNVMAGKKCIVVDGIQGLLAAAVLERLGDEGCVVHVYPEPAPTSTYRHAISALNFSKSRLQSLVLSIQFQEAVTALNSNNNETCGATHPQPSSNLMGMTNGKLERRLERQEMQRKAKEILSNQNMDCLLVASRYDPLNAFCLLDFMAYSRPFAIHAISHQPLVECYANLKARGDVINMNITESFLRHYQVLPERTHPNITESGSGGYLLTGVKVGK